MWKILALSILSSLAQAQDDCGEKPPQRPWDGPEAWIVNGRESDVGAWPWQLSLQYFHEELQEWRHTCGAILTEADWAITAAHCTNGRQDLQFCLVAGAHNIKELTGFEQIFDVAEIIQHPGFSMNPLLGYPNDIGLLRLSSSANLDDPAVDIACIPETGEGDFEFTGNENCWISGWGLTGAGQPDIPDILQEALINVPTNDECRTLVPQLRVFHICARGVPSACSGDSGGPMSCLVDGKWYVAGTTSFGDVFCALLPSVYTRISYYYDWIQENMNRYK